MNFRKMSDKTRPVIETINPHLLDVVKTNTDYVIYYSGSPLTTPSNENMAHPNPRLLEHILRELSLSRSIDSGTINSYTLFATQKDFLEKGTDEFLSSFEEILQADQIVQRKLNSEKRDHHAHIDNLIDFLDKYDQTLTFMFGGISGILRSISQFLTEHTQGSIDLTLNSFEGYLSIFKEIYAGLPLEQKAAIIVLCKIHLAGILLPLLLIFRRITPSEYANTLFSVHLPCLGQSDSEKVLCETIVPGIQRKAILPDWDNPEQSFAKIREHASLVLEYLSYFDTPAQETVGIVELINMGESFNLEFKSTLRWNIKADRKDRFIEHASLKTIAGFLNSGGGTLLIGVRDDGTIEGIETDDLRNRDEFSLHFWKLIKASLGQDISTFIRTSFAEHNGRTIFAVHCSRSSRPVFMHQKNFDEEFYIRLGPSSAKLSIQETLRYIKHRFADFSDP